MVVKPTADRVILKRLPREQVGPVEDMSERTGPETVEVHAAGPRCNVQKGQKVLIGAWGGTIIKGDLLVMNEHDILAVVED